MSKKVKLLLYRSILVFFILPISYLQIGLLCSCSHNNQSPDHNKFQISNDLDEDSAACYINIHGLHCPVETCGFGEKALCQQKPDSLLVKNTYQFHNDSCTATIDINLDYIEPNIKDSWFSEGDSERRWISVELSKWENRILGKKPKVYIPKTLNWSGDSLCNYYGKRFLNNLDPFSGYAYNSISIIKRCENSFYATYYYQTEASGGAHPMYEFGFATVSKSNCLGKRLSFDDIILQQYQDSIYAKVATQLEPYVISDIRKDNYAVLKNNHIALVPEGIVFFYYPGEIECYAAGNLFVIIPYKEALLMIRSFSYFMCDVATLL